MRDAPGLVQAHKIPSQHGWKKAWFFSEVSESLGTLSRCETVRKQRYPPVSKFPTIASWSIKNKTCSFSVLAQIGTVINCPPERRGTCYLDKNCSQQFWLKIAIFILIEQLFVLFQSCLVFDPTPVRTFLLPEALNITGGNICNLKQSGPVWASNYLWVALRKRDASIVNAPSLPSSHLAGIHPISSNATSKSKLWVIKMIHSYETNPLEYKFCKGFFLMFSSPTVCSRT